MQIVRVVTLLLIIMLALFFNIERLNWRDTDNAVNLQTFTYVLTLAAVVTTFFKTPLNRATVAIPLLFWFTLYFLLKLFVFRDRPIWGGINSYLLITEITFLAVLITLSHWVVRCIEAMEKVVWDTSLANGLNFQTVDGARNIIHTELTRSRHYKRLLSVITVDVEPTTIELDRFIQEMQSAFVKRYAVTKVAQEIRAQLRETDQVFLSEKPNQVVIICPETSRIESEVIFDRIQPLVGANLGVALSYGVATFPDDGITINGLLTAADQNVQPVNSEASNGPPSYMPKVGNL